MWMSLQNNVNLENYFFKIKIFENNGMQYYLTDFQNLWKSEIFGKDEILNKAKEINKRIEFDFDKAMDTIKSLPNSVQLEQTTSVLTIIKKYYICGKPFTFDWILTHCDQTEFEQLITIPLLASLSSLQNRNEELLKIIENKQIEINQYKTEGCVLVRNSVATQPIDMDKLKKSNTFMFCDNIKKFEISNNDLEESSKEILSEVLQPVNAPCKSPIKSKKKRMIKKREELAEKRLRHSDNKAFYYDSPSFIEDDEISVDSRETRSDDGKGNNKNRNESSNLEIEEIKNSLAELNRKSEILLQEPI